MSTATPVSSTNLQSVSQAFEHWRATRTKRSATPPDLQQRAVALLDTHRASHICSALSINDVALKRWADKTPLEQPLLSLPQTALVELPMQSMQPGNAQQSSDAAGSLSIDLGSSMQLQIHGNFTLEQILNAARQCEQGVLA